MRKPLEVGDSVVMKSKPKGKVGLLQCAGHKMKIVERLAVPGASDGYLYHVKCSCGNGGVKGRWWGVSREHFKRK